MVKTVTLSTTRIESIKTQFAYALKLLGKMKMEQIVSFLKEIEVKNITEISFHGLRPNSFDSDEDIFFVVDWDKHSELIRKQKIYVENDDTFEDGVAPHTLIECYRFKDSCEQKGLIIEMRVVYPERINNDQCTKKILNERLGLCDIESDEQINFAEGKSYISEVKIKAINEMSIKRTSN